MEEYLVPECVFSEYLVTDFKQSFAGEYNFVFNPFNFLQNLFF